MTPTLMIQRKLDCQSRKQRRKNQTITMRGYSLASAYDTDNLVFTQGLEGVLRNPGFGRNRARDSGIQEKSSRDS